MRILNILFILHADHEQNCSTTTVRTIGSAQVNLYATISAGISALSGPLHGGANQAVIEMLRMIQADGDVDKFIRMAKDRDNPFRLMGFGHRVYKTYDPRAAIIKRECNAYLDRIKYKDPLLDVAHKSKNRIDGSYCYRPEPFTRTLILYRYPYRALGIPENISP